MAKLAIKGGEALRAERYPKWPAVDKRDEEAVTKVVRSGKWWVYSYGSDEFAETVQGTSRVEQAEKVFADMHHAKYAYATANGCTFLTYVSMFKTMT